MPDTHRSKTMRSKTFEQYLFVGILRNFVSIFVVLQTIALSQGIIRIFENILEKKYPYDTLLWVLTYYGLNTLAVVTAFSAMLAVLLTLGQSHHHRESHAAAFIGIGYSQFLRIILSFCIPLTLLLALFNLEIGPLLNKQHQHIVKSFKDNIYIEAIGTGQFTKLGKDLYVFAEQYDPDKNELSNIFIARLDEDSVTIAQRARQKGSSSSNNPIDLYQGYSYQGQPGETKFSHVGFEKYTINLLVDKPFRLKENPELYTSLELLASASSADFAELQRRISMPIILIIASLFALMIYQKPNQDNRKNIQYISLIKGIVFFLVYGNSTILLTKLGANTPEFLYLGLLLHLVLLLYFLHKVSGGLSNLFLLKPGYKL